MTRSIGEFALDIAQRPENTHTWRRMSVISQSDAICNDDKATLTNNADEITLFDGRQMRVSDVIRNASSANSFWRECSLNATRIWRLWNTKTPLLAARVFVTLGVCLFSYSVFTDKVGKETGCLEPFDRNNITNNQLREMFTAKAVR